jgi:hypothetical protein
LKTENLSTLKIHKLTQEQYDRESANGTLDENALYLTPDEEIDFPVDSVNGKTGEVVLSASDVGARPNTWMPTAANVGAVPTSRTVNGKALSSNITLSASDVGALPIGGGNLTGNLNVNDGVHITKNNEGGNIVVSPPSTNTYTNSWEMDSYNGSEFRIFANKKSTNPNGSGYVFPLRLLTDGSISTGNNEQTRVNLGAASASHNHDGRYLLGYALNEINIDNTGGNWTVDIAGHSNGTVPADWVNVTQTTSGHFHNQIARQTTNSGDGNRAAGRIWHRDRYMGQAWSAWTPLVSTANFSYSNGTLHISI